MHKTKPYIPVIIYSFDIYIVYWQPVSGLQNEMILLMFSYIVTPMTVYHFNFIVAISIIIIIITIIADHVKFN